MRVVHQILVAATPGDAITQIALSTRDRLRKAAVSEIFAWYVHPDLAGEAIPMQFYGQWVADRNHDPTLIFHASIGCPGLIAYLLERPERLVLIYHNISPSKGFRDFAPEMAANLDEGRRELSDIRDRASFAVADSEFNARELRMIGYSDVRVAAPMVDLSPLTSTEPDEETLELLGRGPEGPTLLFVGQLLPHKRVELLLQAYHVLVTYLRTDANLLIVGADRMPAYRSVLQQYSAELGLSNFRMLLSAPFEKLIAAYKFSDAFVTVSEHEGYCVPLLEAMTFDLPIVARSCGAIPETIGDAGLLLDETEDPLVIAEGLNEVLENEELRSTLIERGARRLSEVNLQTAAGSWEVVVQDLLAQ